MQGLEHELMTGYPNGKVTNMIEALRHKYRMYRINRGERKCHRCGKWFTTESVKHLRFCGVWICSGCAR